MRVKHGSGWRAALLLLVALCFSAPQLYAQTFAPNRVYDDRATPIRHFRVPRPGAPAAGMQPYQNPPQRTGERAYPGDEGDYLDAVTEERVSRWAPNAFPIRVYIESGEGTPGYRSAFRDFVMQAFDTWSQASSGKLSFRLVGNARQANVICTWDASPASRGNYSEAGYTRVSGLVHPRSGSLIIDRAHITIYTTGPQGRTFSDNDMRRVVLHEVGHAVGMQGHSDHFDDIMFPSSSAFQPPYLSRRDINTIRRLYDQYPRVAQL